jgi:hypothetical protein
MGDQQAHIDPIGDHLTEVNVTSPIRMVEMMPDHLKCALLDSLPKAAYNF